LAVTTFSTGITDGFGAGITGLTPVSAVTGTRAGAPHATVVKAERIASRKYPDGAMHRWRARITQVTGE
jgi:hypothetical protein